MKKHLIVLLAAAAGFMACNQRSRTADNTIRRDSFVIRGTITGLDSGWMVLNHRDTSGNMITDSAKIAAANFTFKGVAAEPAMYYLGIKGRPGYFNFFVENGDIRINVSTDSLSDAEVVGSPTQEEYELYQRDLQSVNARMDSLYSYYETAYKEKNQALMDTLDKRSEMLDQEKKRAISSFVQNYSGSVVSAWAITRNFLYSPDPEKLGELYKRLDTMVQRTSYGREIEHALEIARKLAVGKTAPDFTQNNVNGDPVSLSSFRGKYVLVDFWASWCGPCRAENPNVVKAYNRYKAKGFTVLGVSLDRNREDWLKAIKHDHLDWTQVSDLEYWKNAVAQQYGIRAIPANFLIGPDGKILAKDLRGDELDKKLAEIFNG